MKSPFLYMLSSNLLVMNNRNANHSNSNNNNSAITKVVIVGAGFAGLSVAYHLLKQEKTTNDDDTINLQVNVLEARDRIGGRVYPVSMAASAADDDERMMVDLGGQWVHEASLNNPIRHFMQSKGLSFHSNPQYKDRTYGKPNPIYDEQGQAISKGVVQMASRILYKALDNDDDDDDDSKVVVEDDDDDDITPQTSWRDLVEEQLQLAKASDDRISKIPSKTWEMTLNYLIHSKECYEGGRLEELSASTDFYESKGGPDELPEGSYNSLLEVLSKDIVQRSGAIRLGCHVESIQYKTDEDGNDDSLNSGPVTIKLKSDNEAIHADYCVCTVPLGVLQQRAIRFVPDLPSNRWEAIDTMGMGLLNKIILQFPTRFWNTERFGVTNTDPSRIQSFYDASSEVGCPCLIVFLGGTAAQRVESIGDQQAVEEVMTNLGKLYDKVPEPTSFKVTRWKEDPFSFGSYSFSRLGCTEETYDSLATPLCGNRILFAGEHTSKTSQATVHGAWETGQREAKRITGWIAKSKTKQPKAAN